MKKIIALLVLLLPTTCFGGDFYVGGGLGKSNLNYDLQGWLHNQEQSYFDDQGIGFLNVPIGYSQQFTSSAYKIFVGYEFNKWIAAEFSLKNYGSYSAKAHIDTHVNQATGSVTTGTPPVTYNANVNATVLGEANATASASGYGLSILLIPIHGDTANVFFRLGVENATLKYSANGNYSYQYNGSASDGLSTIPVSGSSSGALVATDDRIHGIVPVVGFGFDWKLVKHFILRTEFERTGDPRRGSNGNSIDMYTMGVLYKF